MVSVGLLLRFEAKSGMESSVAKFLIDALPLIFEEPDTTAWFGIQLGPSTFGIFDAFPHHEGREAHIKGKVADILRATWADMLSSPPSIEKVSILAAKLPRRSATAQPFAQLGPNRICLSFSLKSLGFLFPAQRPAAVGPVSFDR